MADLEERRKKAKVFIFVKVTHRLINQPGVHTSKISVNKKWSLFELNRIFFSQIMNRTMCQIWTLKILLS